MKKVLAIVLALVMAFSAFTMAYAEDAAAADEATTAAQSFDLLGSIKGILDQITSAFSDSGSLLEQVQAIIAQLQALIANFTSGNQADVAGVIDELEAKINGSLVGDLLAKCKALITNLKQKIKDLYAGNIETTVEDTTAAEAPSETGSSAAGLAAFAAISVAAAAAYVCTKKKA